MYLLLGGERVISDDEIVGIFDLDRTTVRKDTRDFLNRAETEKRAQTVSFDELPLTFVVCADKKNLKNNSPSDRVYISPVSLQTLSKRLK